MSGDPLISGRKFGQQLIEAFGLQGQSVSKLALEATPDGVATVTITRLVRSAEARTVQEIATEYQLITEVTTLESERREYEQ